jgi:hypothetical protein
MTSLQRSADPDLAATAGPPALFSFQVSLNEEHAFLKITLDAWREVDLGERVHHYSLLTLARRRLDDAERGLDPSSQGWVDLLDLAKMLGLEPAHLNIQIHRARKQIAGALPADTRLPAIVERRRGGVRLGALRFQIVRGSRLEGRSA